VAYESFTQRIRIKAAPDVVMTFWLMSDLVQLWFVPACRYIRPDIEDRAGNELAQPGDRYEWTWVDGTREVSTVREVTFPLRATFGWFEDTCDVQVTLEPEGEGTLITLIQTNTQETEAERLQATLECGQGWQFYLLNLKSYLEGGIDLRETEPGVPGLINY
jgi:uncharacterized protein YndB with AHSA1/START domain